MKCMQQILFWVCLNCFYIAAFSQQQELEQLKVNLEKLAQMRAMLQHMQNGYATVSNGYQQLTGLAKGNFDLHKNYLDQLLQVAPQVRQYPAVQTILGKQSAVVTESATAYAIYLKSALFSANELLDTKNQFADFKLRMGKKLAQLELVLTPGSLRMSDQERMGAIDRIDKDVGEVLGSLRTLVKEQAAVMAARGQQKKDNAAMRAWYGFKQ